MSQLQESLDTVVSSAANAGLKINTTKTKTMVFGTPEQNFKLETGGEEIEDVDEFIYLGSLITKDNNCSKEINRRIALASGTVAGFKKVLNSTSITIGTKLKILNTCVFSVLLYACETWTIKKKDRRRIESFEMKCYRDILNIRWYHRITN